MVKSLENQPAQYDENMNVVDRKLPRLIFCPSEEMKVLTGPINMYLQNVLKEMPFNVCGMNTEQIADDLSKKCRGNFWICTDGAAHDSHMHYTLQNRIMKHIYNELEQKIIKSENPFGEIMIKLMRMIKFKF